MRGSLRFSTARVRSFLVVVLATGVVGGALAVEPAGNLDELLDRVQSNWREEQAQNAARETEFEAKRADQALLLREATAARDAELQRSESLEGRFEINELKLAEEEARLQVRLGNLGELFGIVRQIAGDTRGQIESSLISSQHPGREVFLRDLGQRRALPSIEDLEQLYGVLLQEMIESSKVSRYSAAVVGADGIERDREVVRVGAFNVIADGRYLAWSEESHKLAELGRQPAGKYLSTVKRLEAADAGHHAFALDPARGAILEVLIETPSLAERIQLGGVVGYTIILLGSVTGLIGLIRLASLLATNRRVQEQRLDPERPGDNPLGRVLAVYRDGRSLDTETLELKLEETILQESSRLERFVWMIKVVSAVTPLMGLLGTVTGMIRTFQIITLFGASDPRLMAGGISEALVTTMLGLIAAIPLLLLHSGLASISRKILAILEEQATGMVAAQAERDQVQPT